MPQARTDLIVQAKAKGFAETQRGLGQLSKASQKAFQSQVKGGKDAQKTLEDMKGRLKDLSEIQMGLIKALSEAGDTGSQSYKEISQALKATERDTTRLSKTIGNMEKALGRAKEQGNAFQKAMEKTMAKGGFVQGFAQGVGVQGLQRGPGMWRQAGGMAMGGAARGLAGTPFGGIQSLAQGLSSVPVVGGLMAAPMMQAAGHAGKAIGFQRQMLEMAPLLGELPGEMQRATRGLPQQNVEEIGARARAQALERAPKMTIPAGVVPNAPLIPGADRLEELRKRVSVMGGQEGPQTIIGAEARRQVEEAGTRAEEEVRASNRAVRAQARGRVRRQALGGIETAGRELGAMERPQAMQFAAQMAQIGGGGVQDITTPMARTAVAAQTRFGVGPETTGAFLRAQRRGGLAGPQGAEALTEALSDAVSMGLKGSEIQEYMQQVAEGINQFRQTGIPFDREAMTTLQGAAGTGLGLGVERGRVVGGQIQQGLQRVAMQGAQDPMSMLLLAQAGGLESMKPMDILKARERLTTKEGAADTARMMQDMFKQAGGAEGGGIGAVQSIFETLGVQAGPGELRKIAEQLQAGEAGEGGPLEKVLRGGGVEKGRRVAMTPEQVQKQAADFISTMGPNLRRQASIADEQLKIGQKMLPAVQNFEKAQTKITEQFTALAAGPITKISEGAVALSESLGDVVEGFQKLAKILGGDKDAGNFMDVVKGLVAGGS